MTQTPRDPEEMPSGLETPRSDGPSVPAPPAPDEPAPGPPAPTAEPEREESEQASAQPEASDAPTEELPPIELPSVESISIEPLGRESTPIADDLFRAIETGPIDVPGTEPGPYSLLEDTQPIDDALDDTHPIDLLVDASEPVDDDTHPIDLLVDASEPVDDDTHPIAVVGNAGPPQEAGVPGEEPPESAPRPASAVPEPPVPAPPADIEDPEESEEAAVAAEGEVSGDRESGGLGPSGKGDSAEAGTPVAVDSEDAEGRTEQPPPAPDADDRDGLPDAADARRSHPEAGAAEAGRHLSEPEQDGAGWAALRDTMRWDRSWSSVVTGVLCAVLGFVLVAEISQPKDSNVASLRDSDLVRLLDESTQRSRELQDEIDGLITERNDLQNGVEKRKKAQAEATAQAEVQGILSGRLPAQGPGVLITIEPGSKPLTAFSQFNILEELRNAGAEAIEVNGVRLVTDSYFVDTSKGIEVDDTVLKAPYRWKAIGDPSTMETALEIPGGAMATVRNKGATATITGAKVVKITSTRDPEKPRYATPVPTSGK